MLAGARRAFVGLPRVGLASAAVVDGGVGDERQAGLQVAEHDERTFEEYVYGSAEVVGLMCLHAFATDDAPTPVAPSPDLVEGARRLGAAFQKVNFLRDLAEDTDGRGRAYFPGLDPASLSTVHRDALVAGLVSEGRPRL